MDQPASFQHFSIFSPNFPRIPLLGLHVSLVIPIGLLQVLEAAVPLPLHVIALHLLLFLLGLGLDLGLVLRGLGGLLGGCSLQLLLLLVGDGLVPLLEDHLGLLGGLLLVLALVGGGLHQALLLVPADYDAVGLLGLRGTLLVLCTLRNKSMIFFGVIVTFMERKALIIAVLHHKKVHSF